MKRAISSFISLISVFIILAFAAYGAFWFYVAGQVTKTLDDIWANQQEYGIIIAGDQPTASGFPAPPKFVFSGSITDRNGVIYAAPQFIFQGFPVETQAVTLSAPKGLDLSGPVFKTPVHIDTLLLKLRIPRNFPARFDHPTLAQWRTMGGTLPIEKIQVTRDTLKLDGEGFLNLDENLQLLGLINVKLSGLDDLLNEMTRNGSLGEKQALMGQSLINLMSHKDETTGETAVNTRLTIQEGGIFIGPFRAASFPQWKWDIR